MVPIKQTYNTQDKHKKLQKPNKTIKPMNHGLVTLVYAHSYEQFLQVTRNCLFRISFFFCVLFLN